MLSSSGREHQTVHVLVHVYSYKNKSLHVLLLLNFITDYVSATRALASGATVTSKKRRAACP